MSDLNPFMRTNARVRPSGENAGPESRLFVVNLRFSSVSTETRNKPPSGVPGSAEAKAIPFESGVQATGKTRSSPRVQQDFPITRSLPPEIPAIEANPFQSDARPTADEYDSYSFAAAHSAAATRARTERACRWMWMARSLTGGYGAYFEPED